jgi:riboflavin synthase
MFTGIVQGFATVQALTDKPGLRAITLGLPPGFDADLRIGASVAVDGVCLTVNGRRADAAEFDVMSQSLSVTTLGGLQPGSRVNIERAARQGDEIGGHPLSGHVDFMAAVEQIVRPENNTMLRLAVTAPWMRYIFPRGYVAVSGVSLTVAEAHRNAEGGGWFEVWLIPETLRVTALADYGVGAMLNIEIERTTRVLVDTVRDAIDERFSALLPQLQGLTRRGS